MLVSTRTHGLVVLLLALSLNAVAADLPKQGKVDFNYCMAAAIKPILTSPKLGAHLLEAWASTYSNPAGGPFDNQGSQCGVIGLMRDGAVENKGYCKMTDQDGDMWLFEFADRNFVGKLSVVGGTGKYDGMTMQADFKPAGGNVPSAAPGMAQTCNRVIGTYTLR
jgi:hypothetical protein